MEKGLVSIIIPVYNVEQYLVQCLDSVLDQTYPYYEAVIVDDGSTDRGGAICDSYCQKDSRFRVIHRENGGLSIARNTGLDAAKGEYVLFLDSDDRIDKDTLLKLTEKALETDADFVFYDGLAFEDSERGYDIPQSYTRSREYPADKGIRVFDDLQKNGDYRMGVPYYFWKREFLTGHGLLFCPGILYEDMLFSFEAFCKANTVAHSHERLYQRRVRPGSIMTSKLRERNFRSICTVFRGVVRIARENGVADRPSVVSYIARCGMRAIGIYSKLQKEDRSECRSEYRSLIKEIRKEKGCGDTALYARTYGKLPWAVCRGFETTIRSRS